MPTYSNEITQLLIDLGDGDRSAVDSLMPMVYSGLHQIAERQLHGERAGHTLNSTALVHEAYLKLVDQNKVSWQNRSHFFAIASQAMRRILINYANAKKAQKRGGSGILATLDESEILGETRAEELLLLDDLLKELATMNERQSKVVEYRFFGGLTHEEIADVLGVSVPTVRLDWRLAKAWLSRELKKESIN